MIAKDDFDKFKYVALITLYFSIPLLCIVCVIKLAQGG